MDVRLENPGGLTGVWAEENTRASLWDAMYRKETFGVSGPHIKVRFFGGWGFNKDILGGLVYGCLLLSLFIAAVRMTAGPARVGPREPIRVRLRSTRAAARSLQ